MHQFFPTLLLVFIVFSCAGRDPQQDYVDLLFSGSVDTFSIELDYMQGSNPETYHINSQQYVWELFEYNMNSLFLGSKTLLVPKTLSEMEEIPRQNKNYARQDIVALAMEHRNSPVHKGNQASLYILFLDGFYKNNDDVIENSILGLSIPGQAMMAVFSPAVALASSSFPDRKGFLQQVVAIHEAGHALGLVNNGLPLSTNHLDQDDLHGTAHCANLNCIMYWQNDSAVNRVVDHVEQFSNLELSLFGQDCLMDAHAYIQ